MSPVKGFLYPHKNTPKVLSNFWGAVHYFETASFICHAIIPFFYFTPIFFSIAAGTAFLLTIIPIVLYFTYVSEA